MGLRVNTTGYITYVGEKKVSEKGVLSVNFTFTTERESYTNKYTNAGKGMEVKYDTMNCMAFGNIAEYIHSNFNKLRATTNNKNVRVEMFGHLEIIKKDIDAGELNFFKVVDNKELFFPIVGFENGTKYRRTTVSFLTKEITFIDIERVKQDKANGNLAKKMNLSSGDVDTAKSMSEDTVETDDLDNEYKELEDRKV